METEDKKNTTNGEEKKVVSGEEKKVVSGEEKSAFQVSEKEWKDFVSSNVKEEIQKEIKFDKASLFTVFGIFASIVTFVSVEIQFLKIFCDVWDVVGFSIIFLASLLTFILILDYIGRGWRNDFKFELKQFPWILIIVIVSLFVSGFIAISFSNKEIACKDEAIFKKYESDFSDKQLELQKGYDAKIQSLENKVDHNQKSIEDLKTSVQSKK
jgi:hypothetical protein